MFAIYLFKKYPIIKKNYLVIKIVIIIFVENKKKTMQNFVLIVISNNIKQNQNLKKMLEKCDKHITQ